MPTDSEWTILANYLGGDSIAGGQMKSTGNFDAGTGLWYLPNRDATNISGFSGVPTGPRDNDGAYYLFGYLCYWWSSSEANSAIAWHRALHYNIGSMSRWVHYKGDGDSVRCLRD